MEAYCKMGNGNNDFFKKKINCFGQCSEHKKFLACKMK